jgi:predicted aldo/keto reductase-like oxidoreductase
MIMSIDHKRFSRRQFLKAAGMAGAGSILASTVQTSDAADETTRVPQRPFGKTGVRVPILSLGGTQDMASGQLMLRQAVKWGVTYWDTAPSYRWGKSEEGIGKYFLKYPQDRKKVFLVTKSSAWTQNGMTDDLNESLERMHTDYIDLFFVHGISGIDEMDRETKAWAEKQKSAQKIRFFGFSTHRNMEACLLGAAELGWIDGIMMTYNYRLMHEDRMRRAVDACAKAGIGLTAMKTQGGGQVESDSETELQMAGRFMRKGFSEAQAKLKAVWENPQIACICSRMPNMSILMANTAAALDRTQLSASEKTLLQRHARETRANYCAGCTAICESALAEKIPVGDVMRYLMYCRSYGERDTAAAKFRKLPEEKRQILASINFSAAEQKCPQKMPIGRLMREALAELG